VITLPAAIKAANVGRVYVAVGHALETGAMVIIADMTETGSCSYAGVQALVSAHIAAAAAGMALRVAAAGPMLRRMLRLTGADRELGLYPDLAGALAGPPAADAGRVAARPGLTGLPSNRTAGCPSAGPAGPGSRGAAARPAGPWSRPAPAILLQPAPATPGPVAGRRRSAPPRRPARPGGPGRSG
jgi:anti-anti-sigma regulatory factor